MYFDHGLEGIVLQGTRKPEPQRPRGLRVWTCHRHVRPQRRKLTLHFSLEGLLFDMAALAYVEGDIMPEEQQHARHQTQDIIQWTNRDRMLRVLDISRAQLKELMYAFTEKQLRTFDFENFNQIEDRPNCSDDDYEIELTVPDSFSTTTIELIVQLAHEYMVCRCLSEWMSIVKPEKADTWMAKAVAVRDEISRAIVARRGPVRRRLSPM